MFRSPFRSAAVTSIVALTALCGLRPAGATGAPTPTARYSVRFDASWSAATHPNAVPANPHFSPLIGGTHDARASFWREGTTASAGIENMAENGRTSPLDAEVEAAIALGQAREVIRGGGINPSPGVASATFTASFDHPLATVVSMIAPSPDWFVGVRNLPLLVNGEWVSEIVLDLYPWDAGTDSGDTFTSPDIDTQPRGVVSPITAVPFAGTPRLGTFIFTRLDAPAPSTEFRRGDTNADGRFDITDPILALGVLFLGKQAPECLKTLDVDDSGRVDIADPIGLLQFLFTSGTAPVDPFRVCGTDATTDNLGCEAYTPCGATN